MPTQKLQTRGSFKDMNRMTNLQLTFKLLTEGDWKVPVPMPLDPETGNIAKKHRFTRKLYDSTKQQVFTAPMLIQVPFLLKGGTEDGDPMKFANGILEDETIGWDMARALFPKEKGQGCVLKATCVVDKHGIIQNAPANMGTWVNIGAAPSRRSSVAASRRSSVQSIGGGGYDYGQKPPLVRTSSVVSTASAIKPTSKPAKQVMPPKPSGIVVPGSRKVSIEFSLWGRAQRFGECHMEKGDQYYADRNNGKFFAGYACRVPFQLTVRDEETGAILAISNDGIRRLKIAAIDHMVHQSSLDGMKIKVKLAQVSNNVVNSIDLTQQKWEPCQALVLRR